MTDFPTVRRNRQHATSRETRGSLVYCAGTEHTPVHHEFSFDSYRNRRTQLEIAIEVVLKNIGQPLKLGVAMAVDLCAHSCLLQRVLDTFTIWD